MKAQITKISTKPSKYTGKIAYLVCFKCEDGRSRTAWVDKGYRNFARWQEFLKPNLHLDNLIAKDLKWIDADSFPSVYTPEVGAVASPKAVESEIDKKTANIPPTAEMFDMEALKAPLPKKDFRDYN